MSKSNRNGGPATAMLVVAAFIAVGALAGCSGTGQDEVVVASPAAVADHARPDATTEPDVAASEPASTPLPEGYPGDAAPIYQPSTVTHAFKMGSGAMLKYMVTAETGDSVDVVASSLADDYRSRGANVSVTPVNEKGTGQVVASIDGYGIVMTYSAGEKPGTTSITYDVHPQRGRR